MAERDNCYILLDLDPEVDDWPTIEARIQDKQREWSNLKLKGDPGRKRYAGQCLESIPDLKRILSNPEARRQEAREAKRQRVREAKARQQRLLEQIEILSAAGTYSDEDIKLVARHLGGTMAERDIEAQFKANGLAKAGAEAVARRPRLDPIHEKAIRSNLDHLALSSLYEFLERRPQSTPAELCRRADEIYAELQRIGKTDTEASARFELIGLCKQVFADADGKAKHDASLAVTAMADLKPAIEVAGRKGFITQEEIAVLIRQAAARGVRPEDARDFIEDHARGRKWTVQRTGAADPAQAAPFCGYCGTAAASPQEAACGQCGEPLAVDCPRCGKRTPTASPICPQCGCDTGDAPLVRALLAEGQQLSAAGKLAEARHRFERVLAVWPDWAAASAEIARLEARRADMERAVSVIEALIAERRLAEAWRQIERLERSQGPGGLEGLTRRVRDGLDRAAALVRDGHHLLAAGNQAAALDHFVRAMAVQEDCEEACRTLETCPPPPPLTLQVTPQARGFRLSWTAPASANIECQIVRKANGLPTGPADGTSVATLTGQTFDDSGVAVGTPWYYAVFAKRGPVLSKVAAVSGPHLLTAEVEDLRLVPGSGQVSLLWRRPPGCRAVEVWRRSGTPPERCGDGSPVKAAADGGVDTGLADGRPVGYLVVAVYDDPAERGRVIRTAGLRYSAVPMAPPPPVLDLAARRQGDTAVLAWTPPAHGTVQIRSRPHPPVFQEGHVIALDQAKDLGALVPVHAAGRAQVPLKTDVTHLVPLTVAGDMAVVGRGTTITLLDPVTNLTSRVMGRTIVLIWDWPAAAERVVVGYRHDAFPRSPEDPAAAFVVCTRAQYDRSGCWELRMAEIKPHHFAVFVSAGSQGLYSPSAQRLEPMGQQREVRYRIVVRRHLGLFGVADVGLKLTSRDCDVLEDLILVGKPHNLPLSPRDGVALLQAGSVPLHGGGAWLPIPRQHWSRDTYVRLFFRDAAQAEQVRLLHGDKRQLRLG